VASAATPSRLGGRLSSIVISLATAFVILGVSIVPLFTPQWIHGEQRRAGTSVPGYSDAAVAYATDATVRALLLGGSFAFPVDPAMQPSSVPAARFGNGGPLVALHPAPSPFFDEREVAHMEDVRRVFQALAGIIGAGVVILLGSAVASRRRMALRIAWWRAIGRGATWLAGCMVVVGVLSIVAFDAAFEVFHELLFPAGSFTFDPARERLVQLFPDQFWSDTSLALGVVALVVSGIVVVVARRQAARLERAIEAGGPAVVGATAVRAGGAP
jgi:integral membrane protein (TIGR01906 family)